MGFSVSKGHCLGVHPQQQWNKKTHYFSGHKPPYWYFCISVAGSALNSVKKDHLGFCCNPSPRKNCKSLCTDIGENAVHKMQLLWVLSRHFKSGFVALTQHSWGSVQLLINGLSGVQVVAKLSALVLTGPAKCSAKFGFLGGMGG